MVTVLSYLPKKWNLLGIVAGSELGDDCFQFRFEDEADLRRVLNERPYQYGQWMIIIQRWDQIYSPTFPSQLPFRINIKEIPLHYWHEKVRKNTGLELGGLEDYQLTKSSARIRLLMDGLQPIIKDQILDFNSGEETTLVLDYENLGNHCSLSNCLTHLRLYCLDRKHANNRLNDTTLPSTFERSRNFNNNGSQRLQSTRAAEDARGDVVANDQFIPSLLPWE